MDKYTPTELVVGVFVLAGLVGLGYLSISLGGFELFPTEKISLTARFASIGDLKSGAAVKMSGVKVGSVTGTALVDYAAEVQLEVDADLELPTDTIASIRTEGLLGESYVLLRAGGELSNLQNGERIGQTEPAIDLIDMFVKYALEGGGND